MDFLDGKTHFLQIPLKMRRKLFFFPRWEQPADFTKWRESERITFCRSLPSTVHPVNKLDAWVWAGSYHPSKNGSRRLPSFNMRSVPRILYEACRAPLHETWRGGARLTVVKQGGAPMCLHSDVNPWKYLPGFSGSTKLKNFMQIELGYESMYKKADEKPPREMPVITPGMPEHIRLGETEKAIRDLFKTKDPDGEISFDLETMLSFGFDEAYDLLKIMYAVPADIRAARRAWDNILILESQRYDIPEEAYQLGRKKDEEE